MNEIKQNFLDSLCPIFITFSVLSPGNSLLCATSGKPLLPQTVVHEGWTSEGFRCLCQYSRPDGSGEIDAGHHPSNSLLFRSTRRTYGLTESELLVIGLLHCYCLHSSCFGNHTSALQSDVSQIDVHDQSSKTQAT